MFLIYFFLIKFYFLLLENLIHNPLFFSFTFLLLYYQITVLIKMHFILYKRHNHSVKS
jgi:hypothetical protein